MKTFTSVATAQSVFQEKGYPDAFNLLKNRYRVKELSGDKVKYARRDRLGKVIEFNKKGGFTVIDNAIYFRK